MSIVALQALPIEYFDMELAKYPDFLIVKELTVPAMAAWHATKVRDARSCLSRRSTMSRKLVSSNP